MKKEKERMNLWKESKYLPLAFTYSEGNDNSDSEGFISFVKGYHEKVGVDHKEDEEGFSYWTLFESAKEAIFDIKDDKPLIHLIIYAINASRGQIEVCHLLDILFEGNNDEENQEDIKEILALARSLDVPVYPNTDNVAPILAKYTHDMLVVGFRARNSDGKYMRLKLTNSPGAKIENFDYLEEISLVEMHSPAELHIIRQAVQQEVDRHKEAERILEWS